MTSFGRPKSSFLRSKRERSRLEQRVKRLRPGSLDPDLIDELARDMLSMVEPDDVIILLEPSTSSPVHGH